jgi:hypothetical protein
MEQPHLLAVIVAAIIPMIIGALWYSPVMFAKKWMALIGKTEEEIKKSFNPMKMYGLSFLASLVMAYVLAHIVINTGYSGFVGGMHAGFWLWLGFVLTTNSSTVLFESRPSGLYWMNVSYYLVSILLMGGLLAVWR